MIAFFREEITLILSGKHTIMSRSTAKNTTNQAEQTGAALNTSLKHSELAQLKLLNSNLKIGTYDLGHTVINDTT